MSKRTITVRGVPDATLRALRQTAKTGRRSLNSELLGILDLASTEKKGDALATRAPETRVIGSRKRFIDPDRDALSEFCRRHHIVWLALFGSLARGEGTPESDVDLAVEFESGRTPGLGMITVAELLAPLFDGRRVDLVTVKGLSPRMRERVFATARVLYDAR